MSNSEFDKRFELIKMARDLLNDEYLNRRAEQHNRWLVIDDKMKRTHGLNVPYPEFVPFPTEDDILKKAQALYAFIDDDYPPDVQIVQPIVEPIVEPIPSPLEKLFPNPILVPHPIIVSNTIPSHREGMLIDEADLFSGNDTKIDKSFLPGWVRRHK